MKKLMIILLPLMLISKECDLFQIEFVKEIQSTEFKVIKNNIEIGASVEPTKNKKLFKHFVGGFEYYKGRGEYDIIQYYRDIEVLNKKNIDVKYSTMDSQLKIYTPEKEIIEIFKIKACRPYSLEKWKNVQKRSRDKILGR